MNDCSRAPHLDVAMGVQEDVAWLQVTVQNGLAHALLGSAVALLESQHNLRKELPDELVIQPCPDDAATHKQG